MAKATPAWRRLVDEGWVDDRGQAERWILSGSVRAGSVPVTSAGQLVGNQEPIAVRGIHQKYASKGGLKLEGALRAFGVDVRERVCIDAGASTGGFVDCLVQHGARRVYAVDVGYGQLSGRLRQSPAVVNLERTNIGDDRLLALAPAPTLGTVDLSYLSLLGAVPHYARIMRGEGELICLVKPLFETEDAAARRTGVLPGDAFEPLLVSLERALSRDGHAVRGVTHSPVTGNNGTVEFFLHLAIHGGGGMPPGEYRDAARAAVQAALALPVFQKSQ